MKIISFLSDNLVTLLGENLISKFSYIYDFLTFWVELGTIIPSVNNGMNVENFLILMNFLPPWSG